MSFYILAIVTTDHKWMIHEQDELATLLDEIISKYTKGMIFNFHTYISSQYHTDP